MVCMRENASRLVANREMQEHFLSVRSRHRKHPISPPSMYAALDRVEAELVGLPGKAIRRSAIRMLRFIVHTVGWLYFVVLHGHICYHVIYLTQRIVCCSLHGDLHTCVEKFMAKSNCACLTICGLKLLSDKVLSPGSENQLNIEHCYIHQRKYTYCICLFACFIFIDLPASRNPTGLLMPSLHSQSLQTSMIEKYRLTLYFYVTK